VSAGLFTRVARSPPDCKVWDDPDPFYWFGFVESGNIPLRRYKKKYGTKWSDEFILELQDMYYVYKTWPGKDAVEKCETIKKMSGEQRELAVKVIESTP